MDLDLWVYGGLAIGFVAGRLAPGPRRWVGPLAWATVVALAAILGIGLGELSGFDPLASVPLALAIALVLVGSTVLVARLLSSRAARINTPARSAPCRSSWTGPILLAVLAGGYASGKLFAPSAAVLFDPLLGLLVALVLFEARFSRDALKGIGVPIVAGCVGAAATGLLLTGLGVWPLSVGLGTVFAFGWYSLAGPTVAAAAGASFGLLAFLVNFLRESLTMLLAPWIARVGGTEGLVASGGATSMDTTFYFAAREGGDRGAALALSSGLILTLLAALLVPAIVASFVPQS